MTQQITPVINITDQPTSMSVIYKWNAYYIYIIL